MKIIPKSTSEIFPWLKIYLDDLSSIASTMNECCQNVRAHGQGYELENPINPSEYKEITDHQLESFRIEGKSPGVTIKTYYEEETGGLEISIEKDDPVSLGIISKIAEILKPRQRQLVAIYNKYSFLIFFAYFFGIIALTTDTILEPYSLSLVVVAGLTNFLLCRLFQTNKYIRFERKLSTDNHSFFHRKRDEITLLIIGALIGAFSTIFLETMRQFIMN